MTAPDKPPPSPPPRAEAQATAIAAMLAQVPLTPVPAAPLWVDASTRAVDPKSLY